MDACMLPRSPWFDPVRNRNSQPATRASSRTNQASEACESKLDDVAQRIDGFKEALRRRATVEQEHGDLALQIKQQRAEVRHRERELAMELARVDNDLASFKAKLASLKSQQSAESLAVLQRASTPLAVEMQWATRHSDSAGAHRIVSPVTVSPLPELLHPKPSEVIAAKLQIGCLARGALRLGSSRSRTTSPTSWALLHPCWLLRHLPGWSAHHWLLGFVVDYLDFADNTLAFPVYLLTVHFAFDLAGLVSVYLLGILSDKGDGTMTSPPTTGSIPLQEFRRDIPPGWTPGDSAYPLRLYFDKLKLWYRICNLDDEIIGPLIAGRLYGRAAKIALNLRVPRPDGGFDTGDAALARLSVDEVRDPQSGNIIQSHIPSGVQYLTAALKAAFGQQDQDLATQALEKFFNISRNKMTLAEYSVEFESRLDEASDRAGLQLNEVGRFFLFFKHSGLSAKTVDDIKLQIGGDYTRFQEARALALRLSPNRNDDTTEIFYGDNNEEENYDLDYWYGDHDDDDGWWQYYDADDGWYDYDGSAGIWYDCYEDDQWYEDYGEASNEEVPQMPATDKNEEKNEDDAAYYKGKGKDNDGKNNYQKGKGYKGKGKGKSYGGKSKGSWGWRPYYKGKGKKGKSLKGKGYGKRSWYASSSSATASTNFNGYGETYKKDTSKGLDIGAGVPNSNTSLPKPGNSPKEYSIHGLSEDEEIIKLERVERTRSSSTSDELAEDDKKEKKDKKHATAFSFVSCFYDTHEYFVVRGQKRQGLIVDPGAASGLIGSETLRELLNNCVEPYGLADQVEIKKDKTSPVSGISGMSDRTLGQVTSPLVTNGQSISFTGEVLGGEGSLCPALIGNPSLRRMSSVIFCNYFEDGDGLLTVDMDADNHNDQEISKVKLFRLLLTESGHYLLPTDEPTKHKLRDGIKQDVTAFFNKEKNGAKHSKYEHVSHQGILPGADAPSAQLEHHVQNDKELTKPCDTFEKGFQQFHSEDDFPQYKEDILPNDMDQAKLRKRYRAIPEEYYSKSGLRPITPNNFQKWFSRAKGRGLKWHFWEVCSGSGRLSLTLLLAGLVIGFPVDARYGWNLRNSDHQHMLDMARQEFQPGVIHHSPDCGPWSVSANTKDPETKHCERLQEQPSIAWVQQSCEDQSRHDRGYLVEQPWGSAMWRDDNESPLRLDKIPENRAKQRCDQCMHDLRDEKDMFIQKATGFGANFKLVKTALRCSGHRGKTHSHLQGQAPNGLSRTAMAAVYPKTMCQRVKQDIINFLQKKNLLKIKLWPQDLCWFTSPSFYECVRCTLGRACPKDIEHSMIPGQCRHGKYAAGTNPRLQKLEDKDPMKRWKDSANKESYEQVIVDNNTGQELTVSASHYIKRLLMETVHNALGLFGEAAQRQVDYSHWIENAVTMALYKEIFQEHMQVKAVKVELRPFNKTPSNPRVASSTAYLRIHITGHVKHWTIQPVEDMREMSVNQINEAIDEENWMVTIYGQEVGAEKPEDSGVPAIEDVIYEEEEFAVQDRKELAPIKPNYNLRRVLERLPKLVENGDITKAKQLLLGLHERLWHTPIADFESLLRRAGQPTEVINLARESVLSCPICRKYIRLPNRPQLRSRCITHFNVVIQIDLFKFDDLWHMIMVDEATRFKLCDVIEGQDAEHLLNCLLRNWIHMFGPPGKVTMDQQMSLMSHETGAEFERLGMERCPKGTTAGQGAEQHTGTGLVERHIQLLKLSMYKLKAELSRQGLVHEPQDLCRECAMAHNITLNYKGVTPSMAVYGILPRGFYEIDSAGILTSSGSTETDVTPFEKAIRIRQTALAQTQQAIIEDRVARASRTRPHQLALDELIPGTSEIEFCREVQGDPGWRGPALLLRLDADEGTAVIQYQGKPYLVALRHIRPYRGIFHVAFPSEDTQTALNRLMRYVESLVDYKIYTYGWLQRRNGAWVKLPKDDYHIKQVMAWATTVSTSMRKATLHGIMMGKSLKTFKPPHNTTGTLVVWLRGGANFSIQECHNANHLKAKKFSTYAKEEICIIYFYYYNPIIEGENAIEEKQKQPPSTKLNDDGQQPAASMDVDKENKKREGPDSRTVVIAPERKKQKTCLVRGAGVSEYGYDIMTVTTRNFLLHHYERERAQLPVLFNIQYKKHHTASACLRTAKIFKVDEETQNINEEDITPDIWKKVDAADRDELKQFIDEKAFKKIHRSQITSDMVTIDARWVRKWKRNPDRTYKIKSRLCARGFLDSQKDQLTTRSTTATRLSQRMLVNQAACVPERTLESLDVAGAFLKGFTFQEIQKALKELGIHAPTRVVVVFPAMNVFRHLAELSPDFAIAEGQEHNYGLICVKPVYGLNDAPLAWQLCLHQFVKSTGGERSQLDENWFSWKEDGRLVAAATTHVDDIALTAPIKWMTNMYNAFVKRFGRVTRQQLPFTHCGCEYTKVKNGYKISQQEFAEKLKPAPIPKRGDEERLTKEETSDLRSILGALLWLSATRLDIIADLSVLQSRLTVAEVKDLKQANQILDKVNEFKETGLYYCHFKGQHQRLMCIHDASSASKGRHYAQEGVLIGLSDDAFRDKTMNHETVFDDYNVKEHNGIFHVLHASGGKAKRVSYSTSHAETLSMVGGLEASTLIMIRLSEIYHVDRSPSLKQLISIQESGNPDLPIDFYGDCKDLWELVTGLRTLPQDKGQRLYVLGIKEARLNGKMRQIVLVPTECMTSDALTKPLVHKNLLEVMTAGVVSFHNVDNHPVTARILPTLQEYSEHDIIKTDDEILEDVKKNPDNVRIGHASILLGMVATGSFTMKTLLASTMMSAAAAYDIEYDETEGRYIQNNEKVQDKSYAGVYIMIFVTVLIAINLDKMISYITRKAKETHNKKFVVKSEPEDEDQPMDVDDPSTLMEVDEDDLAQHYRVLRKRVRKLEIENDELQVTARIKQDAADGFKEQYEEKFTEAKSWEDYSEKVCQDLARFKRDLEDTRHDRDNYASRLDEMLDQRQQFLSERNEYHERYEELREKHDKLMEDFQTQKTVVASSARHMAFLQDKAKETEEREKRQRDSQALFQQHEEVDDPQEEAGEG
ncbi:unnamed protein product [Cladocopium goreaui]|uniref:Integrase catalytic domain-containing protein n=1 Tax=Cladocopium goreaui TaxID=2562237 RepID=A0A9P1C607_9DINO|nr:unnamed protein product [Cladocopium goreaui]